MSIKQTEALKLALEALEKLRMSSWAELKAAFEYADLAIPCIREALAEQPAQQEPVAWMWKDGTVTTDPDRADGTWISLYTSPPASKPWVGLTDEEYGKLHDGFHQQGKLLGWVVDQVEAKLREKNA